jgi:hypothetical protein
MKRILWIWLAGVIVGVLVVSCALEVGTFRATLRPVGSLQYTSPTTVSLATNAP